MAWQSVPWRKREGKAKTFMRARWCHHWSIFTFLGEGKNAYEDTELKIEAYLVRLCVVQLLPVIPDFVHPFANDSLIRHEIGVSKRTFVWESNRLTLTRSFSSVTRASLIQIIQHFIIHCQILNIAVFIIVVLIVFIFRFNHQFRVLIVRVSVFWTFRNVHCLVVAVVLVILLIRIVFSLFVGNGQVVWWSRGSGGIW